MRNTKVERAISFLKCYLVPERIRIQILLRYFHAC